MKIVFLDIDGVLATIKSCGQGGKQFPEFDARGTFWPHVGFHALAPDCVANLNKIIAATGASIVVSSTWRMGDEEDFWDLAQYLQQSGVNGEILGRTPNLKRYRRHRVERGDEIQAWINLYKKPIESFVILDDESDMAHLKCKLVQSKGGWFEKGLEEHHADEAIAILSQERFWDELRSQRRRKNEENKQA